MLGGKADHTEVAQGDIGLGDIDYTLEEDQEEARIDYNPEGGQEEGQVDNNLEEVDCTPEEEEGVPTIGPEDMAVVGPEEDTDPEGTGRDNPAGHKDMTCSEFASVFDPKIFLNTVIQMFDVEDVQDLKM